METRQYKFNESTLTVKFGNIIESLADVVVSSYDNQISMGVDISRAILQAGGEIIIKDAQKMIAIARNLSSTNKTLNVELYLFDIYNPYSKSDYVTLYESLAAKAALVEYRKCLANEDSAHEITPINKELVLPNRNTMKHQVFISYSRKDKDIAQYLCDILKKNDIEYWIYKEGIYSSFNYKELIVDAIDISKVVIFISSHNSNSSASVIREIGYTVNMNKPIIPLMLDDTLYTKVCYK